MTKKTLINLALCTDFYSLPNLKWGDTNFENFDRVFVLVIRTIDSVYSGCIHQNLSVVVCHKQVCDEKK